MSDQRLLRSRDDLSEFLIHHRAKLSPASVGLPTSGRRRTPGLRREEVAQLAGVGLTWYTWFEQGREIQVSESFLLHIAKALRLSDSECCQLFQLVYRRPPPATTYHWATVTPTIQQLMDDLVTKPAYVLNLRWDVVAWNAMADQLFRFAERDPLCRNLMRLVFADPDMRCRMPEWQQDTPRLLAQFRSDLSLAPDDNSMLALIDELTALSPDFRRGMKGPILEGYSRGLSAVVDDQDIRRDFTHETLLIDEYRHLRMVVSFPA